MTEAEYEIRKKVMERYPFTKKERTCWQEKLRMTNLREAYKKRLSDEARETEIQRPPYQETKSI